MISQVMALNTEISSWLFEQGPLTVVLGVVIWWLSNRLSKAEKDKDEISKEVIKLATLWEKKTEKNEDEEDLFKQQIIKSLDEIKSILNK